MIIMMWKNSLILTILHIIKEPLTVKKKKLKSKCIILEIFLNFYLY